VVFDELLAALADRERELWVAAVLCYGVGDTLTTFVGLSATTGSVAEAGPVAGPFMAAHGHLALLAVKAVIFVGFYLVWLLLRTPGRAAVPLALSVVGATVSLWNIVVILTAG
jgi:hypothetical protein